MADFELLGSGGHKSLAKFIFAKLKPIMGTANISNIGDGTPKGAIRALYDTGIASDSYGIVSTYLTNGVAFGSSWLSLTPPTTTGGTTTYGDPLTPEVNNVYMILSDGEYLRRLVTWDGTKYSFAGVRVNSNGGVETDLYVPNTASADGQAGFVPPSPAGAEAQVLTNDGWDDVPFDITPEEIDEIFGRVLPQQITYSADEAVVGEYNGAPMYAKTLTGLNASASDGATVSIGTISGATKLIDIELRTATGTYTPKSASMSSGAVSIVGWNGGTITEATVYYAK